MSELNLKLSDSYATGQAPFHDWEYKTFGNPQANQAATYLVLENTAGNEIEIWAEFDPYLEESTGNMVSQTSMEVKKLTIGIGGGIERSNFLEMLQLILNAEKIGAKLIP